MSNEDTIVYIFLYDDKKLTQNIIDILGKIKDIDFINKITIDSNAAILKYNTRGIIIKPDDLPVYLVARTSTGTKVYPGTMENTMKFIELVSSLWRK